METNAEPTQMSLTWLEIWRSSFFRPTVGTFTRIISDPKASIRWGLLWIAITSMVAWFVGPQKPLLSGWVSDNFGPQAGSYFLLIGAIAAAIFGVILMLILADIAHGLARHFDGAGTFHQLFYCWAVMGLPFMLLSELLTYISSLFSSNRLFYFSTAGKAIQIITLLMFNGVNLYLMYAEVVAFSAVEKFRFWKSFGIWLLTGIVFAVAIVCLPLIFALLFKILPGLF